MASNVLVTGSSGYLGRVLVARLLSHPEVQRVVGLDAAPSSVVHPKFKHYGGDIRDEFYLRSLLQEEKIDTIFHLAFIMGEPRDHALAMSVNVGGTLTVLEAASKSVSVRKLVISGSASAYGARSNNPKFLSEDRPLRARTLRYGVYKREVEEQLAKAIPEARKDLQVTILRVCTIVGSSARGKGPVTTFCELPCGVSVLFRKGGLQFIHEDDLMDVMLRVMQTPSFRGIYNVAPDDCTTIAALCRKMGKPRLAAPYSALWLAFFLARRLLRRSDVTENVVSYLAYPVVLSNQKIKRDLGVSFKRGSEEAFLECARALNVGHQL